MNSFRAAIEGGGGFSPSGPSMPEKRPSGASEEAGLGSVPVPRSTKRSADHRDGDRHRLSSEQAELLVRGKKRTVELVNLSGGGAMIATDADLQMWQKVHLVLGGEFKIECAVRWIRGGRIGLEFAHETQIEGASTKRDSMLLDVLRRSFPDIKSAPAAPITDSSQPKGALSVESQKREAQRHPLIWSGEIHYNHDSERVRLRNISESGALVESPRSFPIGAEILLDLGNAGQHFAKISWSHGDQIGVKFDRAFDIGLLSRSRPQVADHRWARPEYLRSPKEAADAWNDWNHSPLSEIKESLEGFLKR
ncbi:PilZ domain-containing protein [Sphingomonas sp. HDW15A]|uniref:PilZ domain-containing protein n=1 Tax=Sphingomonas sp. HDW15A TaxID=2714942 RepID=UPI00140CFEC0|nr:PilZ domain-containing protein [Sphingomonas sp. HDW15A]QIK96289.1 PilZ domain-containing protein [Sphingomonas sp. HDW15A]